MEVTHENGRTYGRTYCSNGQIRSEEMLIDGVIREKKTFFQDGMLRSEVYFDEKGKKHGLCRSWYNYGAPRKSNYYVHGKKRSDLFYADNEEIEKIFGEVLI